MALRIIPLEDRIMFDAAGAAVVADAAVANSVGAGVGADGMDSADLSATFFAGAVFSDLAGDVGGTDLFADDGAASSVKVLVVASATAGSEVLAAAANEDVIVVNFDSQTTSLEALSLNISTVLEDQEAQSISFATHGVSGSFYLTEDIWVSEGSLAVDAALQGFWQDIGALVQDGGHVDFLGCNVADGGEEMLAAVDALLDVDGKDISVNASLDATGSEELGGNWILEYSDNYDASVLFDPERIEDWDSLMAVGVTVTPTSGLVTTELGGTATFTIVLDTNPGGLKVVIPLSSNDITEGVLSITKVEFNTVDWNIPRAVTVTGVNDPFTDGDQTYKIITGNAIGPGTLYNGLGVADVSVTNRDDESAGITVTPTSGLVTTETGGTASFTIVLDSPPTGTVTIVLPSSDSTEGTTSPSSVVFNASNYGTPQTVTVTGVDDIASDGDQSYEIRPAPAVSTDVFDPYQGMVAATVSLINTDDDVPGITATPTSGLVTTELGGTASFTIVLDTAPGNKVVIPLSSNDITEGVLSIIKVEFNDLDWHIPRTVTVTGVDDPFTDGDQAYKIITGNAIGPGTLYDGLAVADVSVTNLDDEVAGITVMPTSGLVTTEAGGTASFTIVLDSKPTTSVTIDLTSSNTSEGTVSSSQMVFFPVNYATPQTVTVTGVDDGVDDGDQLYSIQTTVTTMDFKYSSIDPDDVTVTNLDDDTAGIIVTPTAGLTTTEGGGTSTFTIMLNSEPTTDVTIDLTSGNTSEGTVAPSQVVFNAGNYGTPQTVTVTGVDDGVDDGDQTYSIQTTVIAMDFKYSSIDPDDVTVINIDDDTAQTSTSGSGGSFLGDWSTRHHFITKFHRYIRRDPGLFPGGLGSPSNAQGSSSGTQGSLGGGLGPNTGGGNGVFIPPNVDEDRGINGHRYRGH